LIGERGGGEQRLTRRDPVRHPLGGYGCQARRLRARATGGRIRFGGGARGRARIGANFLRCSSRMVKNPRYPKKKWAWAAREGKSKIHKRALFREKSEGDRFGIAKLSLGQEERGSVWG